MLGARALMTLVCAFSVFNGCRHLGQSTDPSVPSSTTIEHHAIGTDVFGELRLPTGRDVFVRISDANTLIYDYTLESRDVVIDSAARDALRALLSAPPSPLAPPTASNRPAPDTTLRPDPLIARTPPSPLTAFQEFADSVFASSGELVSFVRVSDEAVSAIQANDGRSLLMGTLPVREYLHSDGALQARAESLWVAVSPADKRVLLPRKNALDAVIPRMVSLHAAIQRATFGDLWLHRNSGSADAAMIELTIASKLAPHYPGVRWTGKGKDVALVRASFPRIAWTAGMGGVFRSDRAFHLTPSSTEAGKFVVTRSSDSRLAFTPLGMLTLQGPCCGGSTIGGISAGVGLRSGAAKLDDGADLFLMGTLGLDWLRLSLGGAYTAEVYDLQDVKAGDVVDSPNALNAQRTKRRLRPALAIHMAF